MIIFSLHFQQPLIAQIYDINVTELNSNQGLSGLTTLKVFVDAETRIWIETEHGMDQWDGRQFIKTPLPAIPIGGRHKSGRNISTIGEDEHSIYFIYDKQPEFYHYYDKTKHEFRKALFFADSNLISEQITSARDKNNLPWVLHSQNDELIINPINGTNKIKIEKNKLPNSFIREINIGKTGVWLRDSMMQLSHVAFDGTIKTFKSPKAKGKLAFGQITNAFHEDMSGDFYFSNPGYSGLYRQRYKDDSPVSIAGIPSDQLIVNLWEDELGRKLIALSKQRQIVKKYMIAEPGLNFLEWNFLADQSVVPTDIISTDFYQLIYYGTYQGLKIIKFKAPYIRKLLMEKNVANNQYGYVFTSMTRQDSIHTIASTEDFDGYILNSLDTGCHTFPVNSAGEFTIFNNTTSTLTSVIATDNYEIDLITRYNVETKAIQQLEVPAHIVSAVLLNDTTIIYCGSQNDQMVLYEFNDVNGNLKLMPPANHPQVSASNVNYMFFDHKNQHLYFCTFDNGLLRSIWQNHKLQISTSVAGVNLPTKNIISVNLNHQGDLLVGSYNGLYILDAKTQAVKQHFTKKDGLSNNVVTAVLQDHAQRYWISTFSGLNLIDPVDFRIGKYAIEDGISHNEFNRNAAVRSPSGMLYFGSANGITSIDPIKYDDYNSTFCIQFSHAQMGTIADDMRIDTLSSTPLEISINNLSHFDISLGNNSWESTAKVVYYYQIQGLESIWNKSTTGDIRIDRLPPGEFNVRMKALSGHGQWSSNTLDFPITVYTPFFNRTWVRIVLLALALALFASSFFWRKQKQLKQRLEFQQRVSDLELSLLQSQMNPHFIFNALGSIQYYIFKNEKDIAEEYLSKFASLMRMFLESSRNKFISLKDELKLLSGYIELEHMRFPDKFLSEIKIDLEDSPDNYFIPSMLLQPFVENSINHGLFHLTTTGRLTVSIHDDDDFVYCTIEDTGIGRTSVKALRAQSLRKHKSRATQITEERIEILKEVEKLHLEIEYHDFSIENDGHTGTRVTIKIPSSTGT